MGTVTALHAGDRVWVGASANSVPAHILSIHPRGNGVAEYVVRTLDLAGKAGENLNLRVRESAERELVRPRAEGELQESPSRQDVGNVRY
jgi:hypothetical protein